VPGTFSQPHFSTKGNRACKTTRTNTIMPGTIARYERPELLPGRTRRAYTIARTLIGTCEALGGRDHRRRDRFAVSDMGDFRDVLSISRIMTDRKKPGAAFWAVIVAITLALYLFSIGPAFLACSDSRGRICDDWMGAAFLMVYDPIIWTLQNGPRSGKAAVGWYLRLWGAP
jgi:hypothetical protein